MLKRNSGSLPTLYSNSSCVTAGDLDNDGDLDLFVGGKGIPSQYPYPDRSRILLNDAGKFTDVTEIWAPDLSEIGMITDAVFSDPDSDGDTDLMIVGEWMSPTLFMNNGETLEGSIIVEGKAGWYYSITAGDLDNDGDEDYLLGNLGLNNKFGAKPGKPFHVYAADFDNTGTLDIVLSKEGKEGLLPLRGRECSSQQMPFIEDKFPTYKNFAEAGLDDIYGEESLSEALHLTTETFASSVLLNDGKGNWELTDLPNTAQTGPLLSAIITDVDRDGQQDVIGAGNIYNAEVETVRYDASKGSVLKGNPSGKFTNLPFSGFLTKGNVKDIELIEVGKRSLIIVAVNDGPLQVFELIN